LIHRGEKIFFGATVTIEDEDGKERQYAIVGADEVDVAKGRISWISPLGAALLKASVGDWVQFRTPKGLQEVQVVAVRYVPLP
jgi:transcription elongation factor GreB